MTSARTHARAAGLLLAIVSFLAWFAYRSAGPGRVAAQGASIPISTFAGNAQHTAIYQTPTANLNAIRWSTSMDLSPSGGYAHYGAPLVTAAPDTEAPAVTFSTPAAGATSVSVQVKVKATFSEEIQPSSLSFVLRNSSSTVVPAAVDYDTGTRTATLTPSSPLLQGAQTYQATVETAMDLAGNALASPVQWTFVTALGFQDAVVFSGLTEPTVMQFSPDGRVFVAEKSGLIKVFASLAETTPAVFADLRTSVHNFWDRGLLGLALHPNFPATPYVYVLYTFDAPIGGTAPTWGTVGATSDNCPTPPGPVAQGCAVSGRLSRLTADPSGTQMVPGSELVLINDWFQQFPSHSIGSLVFGSDDALYASGGDGASYSYVEYGQTGNPGGDPPLPAGSSLSPPTAEGGALRSQDLRTRTDSLGLNGTVIRIDPVTGLNMLDNPLASDPELNARRIVAHGFRNPFRMTSRPGTSEIWVGDVGWNSYEEINRIVPSVGAAQNFGWPCYEGNFVQSLYDQAGLNLCADLYNSPGAVVLPLFTYSSSQVHSGDPCNVGGGKSITGLAFYTGNKFPANYQGALFFSDFTFSCIWTMFPGADGVPDPSTIAVFSFAPFPVDLKVNDGDIYYADILGGEIHRIRYYAGNQPPTAELQATPQSGDVPLLVSFDGSASADPDGDPLSFSWDLNGDGVFGDATGAQTTVTFTQTGAHTVALNVTDDQGLSDVKSLLILAGDTSFPEPFINAPLDSLRWKVGDVISFAGGATDAQDGVLPPSALSWSLLMRHCPSACHTHPIQGFSGTASGSFAAPDHEYPSHLELRLTATDSSGLQMTKSQLLLPATVDVTFESIPSGLSLGVGGGVGTTPFVRTVIEGGEISISAPLNVWGGAVTHQFTSWSDGRPAAHNIGPITVSEVYRATYATRVNVAAAGAGATATASSTYGSGYAASGAINGDRKVSNGGGWNDGTESAWPDWLEVTFNGVQTIDEVDVFSVQDAYATPVEPTAGQTFTQYGLQNFEVQYWTGSSWAAVPGGTISGNTLVWRQLTFAPVTTTKIRVWITSALNAFSRVAEVEAYTTGGPANALPTVQLTSPSEGASYTGGAVVDLTAAADDSDGTVARVEFYVDGGLIATDVTSPYVTTWTASVGSHTLTAQAWDNSGATVSAPVHVTVTGPPGRVNVAAASTGATATASSAYGSGYAASGVINGDRKGQQWSTGGGWNDGTWNAWPDWLEVTFNGVQTIDEVDVFSVQDAYATPVEPTAGQTFTQYGLQNFEVQYWTGSSWAAVPGGTISGNTLVWRQLTFAPVTTTKIRVWITSALNEFYGRSVERLREFPKVVVRHTGVGATTRRERMSIKGDMTGIFADNPTFEDVEVVAIGEILAPLPTVDLLKLNIEGMEFEVLEAVLAEGLAPRLRNIQVQFHPILPDCERRHAEIRRGLLKTHRLTFDAPWCWENYSRD